MSHDYIRPEKPDHMEDAPPTDITSMTTEQIRNPQKWSNGALTTMIQLKLDSVKEMITILQTRAEQADDEAKRMLHLLINKKAEDHVALE